MKIKAIKIVLLSIILFILILRIFKIGIIRDSKSDFIQIINKVFVGNQIIVTTSSDLSLQNVKITIANSGEVVFENGSFKDNIWEIYGGPVFDVYYQDRLVGHAFHDNTNDWYVNEFIFHFFKINHQIRFNFTTHGKDKYGDEGYDWIEENNETSQFFTSL